MQSTIYQKRAVSFLLKIFILALFIGQEANAQRTPFPTGKQSIQTYKDYFNNNLRYLSNIEGIYDVSMIPNYSGGNMLSGVRQWGGQELGTTAVIYKNESDSYSCKFIFNDINDQIDLWHFGSHIFTLTPLSSGADVYRVEGKYNEDYSHFGNSGQLVFTISTRTVWDRGIIEFDFTGYDQFHMVKAEVSMVKTFPTPSQINGANTLQPQQPLNAPEEWSGTGFALKNGYIVTNYHVIEGASTITIQGVKGNFNPKYTAAVVGSDKVNDLALLKISDSNFSGFGTLPYSITSSTSDIGEEIFVLGYPLTSTMGDEIKLTTGIISSKTGYQGDVALYQISAPIQPGNSGGPLFDKKGNIIGVVSAKHAGAENVGYAIKSSYLRNLIESCVSASIIPTNNTVSTLPLTEKVKAEKNFVFYIQCSSSTNMISTSSASRVINNPYVGSDNLNDEGNNTLTKISKVEITPSYTSISFTLRNYAWCSISSDTYIKVGDKKYYLTRIEGIEYSPNRTYPNQVGFDGYSLIECTFYFPPIPSDSRTLDFIEPNSRWQFFNVSLTN